MGCDQGNLHATDLSSADTVFRDDECIAMLENLDCSSVRRMSGVTIANDGLIPGFIDGNTKSSQATIATPGHVCLPELRTHAGYG
ncbi:hypothetical protein ACJ72_00126 [Emergomyces africanus]|uniref:Uncharacterized protein n=1 Tax=Emergomyces africanus TaxID=1955775 RepID=A0A1B7P8X7_9EURO|nr:hypothetical protein ACJ72_00126 [Emergomyces africanus]